MKKIMLLISFFMLFQIGAVNAASLNVDYIQNNGKYELKLYSNQEEISYDEAKREFGLDDYFSLAIEGKMYYFYKGLEVTKTDYESGVKISEIKSGCDGKNYFCIDVKSQEDLINKIDEIYSSRIVGSYHLLYDYNTYKSINFNEVNKYYKDKYMTDLKKNAYTYSEYGLMDPVRYVPSHNEYEMQISTINFKTTVDEEKLVDKFLESFLPEFENKSDYEKILGVYSYLSKTSSYATEDGITTALKGRHSPYDVLLTHKHVCIGASTTFQFLMEKLGIESYIIDHVSVASETVYHVTHVYNVVKLEDRWFIVDVTSQNVESSMLVSNKAGKYDIKDFKYLGIKISDKSYSELHPDAAKSFNIDYDKYVKLADKIVSDAEGKNDKKEENEEKPEEKEKAEPSFSKEFLCIISIVSAICVVIVYFAKKA